MIDYPKVYGIMKRTPKVEALIAALADVGPLLGAAAIVDGQWVSVPEVAIYFQPRDADEGSMINLSFKVQQSGPDPEWAAQFPKKAE